jgi:hypothetical protein
LKRTPPEGTSVARKGITPRPLVAKVTTREPLL